MTVQLNCKERNGFILYLGYNNYHVEDTHSFKRIAPREFDDLRDAEHFFNNISQRGNK